MVRKFYYAPKAAPPEPKETACGHIKTGELIPDMEGADLKKTI